MTVASMGRGFVLCVGLMLVAVGGVRVASEVGAALGINNLEDGFRTADGFEVHARQQALRDAVVSGDRGQVMVLATGQLETAPFDPVAIAILARARMAEGTGDLRILSAKFDQAVQIAPQNKLVRALRADARYLLLNSQSIKAPAAK